MDQVFADIGLAFAVHDHLHGHLLDGDFLIWLIPLQVVCQIDNAKIPPADFLDDPVALGELGAWFKDFFQMCYWMQYVLRV